MIKETYLVILKKMRKEHPEADFVAVTRTAHIILAPSQKLLQDYKQAEKKLGDRWKVWYELRYKKEVLNNQDTLGKIKEIAGIAKRKMFSLSVMKKTRLVIDS